MKISIQATVRSDIDTVWNAWNSPEDIKQWNTASDDWHTTQSSVDLCEGGTFFSRMEAKDGSMGFNFKGTFTKIIEKQLIEYSLEDNRKVVIKFTPVTEGVNIEEIFDSDSVMEPDQQRQGWQRILNNFAKYVESKL